MMRGDEEELLDPSKVVQQEVGVESVMKIHKRSYHEFT
jgi:hypothetical protein